MKRLAKACWGDALNGSKDLAASKMKVVVAGFGDVGKIHAAASKRLPETELVAIADPRVAATHEALEDGTPCYATLSEAIAKEQPDIVIVATPASFHRALAVEAMNAGVHCLVEKPIALSVAEAQDIIDTSARTEMKVAYGSCYRFLPVIRQAKHLIETGAIGDVRVLRETVIGGQGSGKCGIMPESHYPRGGPGGFPMGIIDHGIHLVDAFSWLTDSEVATSFGRGNISGQPVGPEYLSVVLKNGAVGHLAYDEDTFATDLPQDGLFGAGEGWYLGGYHAAGDFIKHPNAIHIHGTHGSLRLFHYANRLFLNDAAGLRELSVEGKGAPYHFDAQLSAFVTDIKENRPPSVPASAGLMALETVLPCFSHGSAAQANP